jgi:hypothetical protein
MFASIRGAGSFAPQARRETLRMNSQLAVDPGIQGQSLEPDARFQSYLRERSGDAKGYYRGRAGKQRLTFSRPMTDDMVPSASLSSVEKLP